MNSQTIAQIVAKVLANNKVEDLVVGGFPTTKLVQEIEKVMHPTTAVVATSNVWPSVIPKALHINNAQLIQSLLANPDKVFKEFKDASIPTNKRMVKTTNGNKYTVFMPSNDAIKIFVQVLLKDKARAELHLLALHLSTLYYYTTVSMPVTIGNYFKTGQYKGFFDELLPLVLNNDVTGLKKWLSTWQKVEEDLNYIPSKFLQK